MIKGVIPDEGARNGSMITNAGSNPATSTKIKIMKYIFVLDFMESKVYKYDVRSVSKEHEDYLLEQGHSLSNIEWMVTDNDEIITD